MYNLYTVVGSVAKSPDTHGGEEGGGLGINFATIGFSIINLLILFLVLRWILFKPITNMMKTRTDKIKRNIADAESNKVEAERLKNEYKERLDKLKEEANTIISNAHQRAQAEAEELLKKAKYESELILTKAREEGEREVQKALEGVKNQVASLALQAATKVIQQNMDNDANRKLVEEFIDEVGAA